MTILGRGEKLNFTSDLKFTEKAEHKREADSMTRL